MLNPRIITSLLIDSNQNLVKTTNFDNRKYIGDPFNASYIFSNYEVDELLILDIDASRFNKSISYDFVESLTNFTNNHVSACVVLGESSDVGKYYIYLLYNINF